MFDSPLTLLQIAVAGLAPTLAIIVSAIIARRTAQTVESKLNRTTAETHDKLRRIESQTDGNLADAKRQIANLENRLIDAESRLPHGPEQP